MKILFFTSFAALSLSACQPQSQQPVAAAPIHQTIAVDRSNDLYLKKSTDKHPESYLRKTMQEEQDEKKRREKDWGTKTPQRPKTRSEADREKEKAHNPFYRPEKNDGIKFNY